MKFYIPNQDKETCSQDVSIYVENYRCYNETNAENNQIKILELTLKNKGLFNITGFVLKGAENYSDTPIIMLKTIDEAAETVIPGRYYFKEQLKAGTSTIAKFDYTNDAISIGKIQIQPFAVSSKNKILLCDRIADVRIENCDGSSSSEAPILPNGACADQTCDDTPANGLRDSGKTCGNTFSTWYNKPGYLGLNKTVNNDPDHWIFIDNEWAINTSSLFEDISWYWFQGSCSAGTYPRFISINSATGWAYGTNFYCNQTGTSFC